MLFCEAHQQAAKVKSSEEKDTAEPPSNPTTWGHIALFLLNAVAVFTMVQGGCSYWQTPEFREGRPVRGADPNASLIVEEPGLFDSNELYHMKSNASRIAVNHGEDPSSFTIRPEHDRGFLIHFTRDAMEHFRSHQLSWILPFVERSAKDSCNAFVFELLIIPLGASKARHRDSSLIRPAVLPSYTAHTVSVLYARIPNGTVGGELVVSPMGDQNTSDLGETLVPSEGLLAHIRGDALHGVERLCPSSSDDMCEYGTGGLDAARISLVLEQYKLPKSFNEWAPDFLFQPMLTEQLVLSGLSSIYVIGPLLCDLYLAIRRNLFSMPGSVAATSREL